MERFAIRPHKDAPLFSSKEESQRIITELISEVNSEHFDPSKVDVLEYLKQASLVNLWFFLKVVAGFSGPYEKLNDDLHLDMCNFRQSDACMEPGARAAAFIPRGHYKSTIFTHGANTWELVRNPNLRIRIVNAVIDKAHQFKRISQRTFDGNQLFGLLFPQFVPKGTEKRWNEQEFVLGNRERMYSEPSVKVGGVGGSSEGDHHDLLVLDDLIGLDNLNANREANALMQQAIDFFNTNTAALLDSWKTSRIVMVATRYATDDVYSLAWQDMKSLTGFQDEDAEVREDGTWNVYYRLVEEPPHSGNIVFPENFTVEGIRKLERDDWWTAATQYFNKPESTGLAELYDYTPKRCSIRWSDDLGEFIIRWEGGNFGEKGGQVRLNDCDVVMSVDPAGTEKGVKSRTSRTSIGIWAMDSSARKFRIWGRVGYFDVNKMFDYIFEGHKKFPGYVRGLAIESNAMQKVLLPLIRSESFKRDTYVNIIPVFATYDKDARIRNSVGLALQKGEVYLTDEHGAEFREELKGFPISKKKDVLDESDKAFTELRRPFSAEEVAEAIEEDEEFEFEASQNIVGY